MSVSVGREHLEKLHEALAEFEGAIKERERHGIARDTVGLQQTVDSARKKIVDVVVQIVVRERQMK